MLRVIVGFALIIVFVGGLFTALFVKQTEVNIDLVPTENAQPRVKATMYYFSTDFDLNSNSVNFNQKCVQKRLSNYVILTSSSELANNKDFIVDQAERGCGVVSVYASLAKTQ